jgi:hypothetical protein
MSSPTRSLLALTMLAAACASARPAPQTSAAAATPAPAEQPAESGEARIARMLAPEGTTPLTAQPVALPNGSFRSTAQGTAAVTIRPDEDRFVVQIPVGGQSNVECVVFPEIIDLANALRITYETVRRSLPTLELRSMNAGFVGDSPYVDLQFLYVVESPRGRMLGHVKLRGANVAGRGLLCSHDEPGFVETFDRATRSLLEQPAASPPVTRYLFLLDDTPCGVATGRRVAGTTTEDTSISAMLLARSAQDLVATDDAAVEHYNRAGELVDLTNVHSQNGEVSRYVLRRTAATRRYHVEGRHLGRDIAGDFEATAALRSVSAEMHRAWQTFRGRNAPDHLDFQSYSHTNPLAATAVSVRLDRRIDNDHLWLNQRLGEIELRALMGPSEDPDEIVATIGDHTLTQRLVTR